ncbi:UDP-N-acetylmuramate dehydrogenase [Lactobacillus sp. W8089]|nr:UDP-N-acetylmuramate dehydrogenase [Lactobacillus sp. W8086]MBI0108899.1 UDP-N-acetylmuramate dehydrogenase [Lactobacillus sp. W8085]MBI0112115.1 UDP-N-acetylmuramate dehydrogenase [Lactobacillus sp. W8088]MBI0115831.1 UDP-N-acetylmuramate dehydrogenase [Lactobacillus sp. W8087]MBI0119555.1 UDP-N-acetylmuramate dehydrogenase [Lactobacillus sp. W8089]MBI0131521.1 UDP-N-acetylmuramate dehydrogenase [Lactobacillus sp. W8090]
MTNDLLTLPIKIKTNEPLSRYTYTKTGGPADYLAFPTTRQELKDLLVRARKQKMPVTTLGNSSNLIIKDGGIRGLVIMLPEFNKIEVKKQQITAEAGAAIIAVTKAASKASLTGLEFAAGIPGSVGGAIFMNAGAYGGEIANVVNSIDEILPDGREVQISGSDLHFGYRHSIVQENHGIVVAATFNLEVGQQPQIQDKMDELNALRRSKQPLEYPSCGSVFKRPQGHFTGPLIIKAGLQGKSIGGAQVSNKHAGFIINTGNATATDYLQLIQLIQKTVKEKFAVQLETEVRIIGED